MNRRPSCTQPDEGFLSQPHLHRHPVQDLSAQLLGVWEGRLTQDCCLTYSADTVAVCCVGVCKKIYEMLSIAAVFFLSIKDDCDAMRLAGKRSCMEPKQPDHQPRLKCLMWVYSLKYKTKYRQEMKSFKTDAACLLQNQSWSGAVGMWQGHADRRNVPGHEFRSRNIVDILLMYKTGVLHWKKKKKKKKDHSCVFSNHMSHLATYFSDDHQLHSLLNVWWLDLYILALYRRRWASSHAAAAALWTVWIQYSSRVLEVRLHQ